MKAQYKPKERSVADLVEGKLYDVKGRKRKTQEEWLLIENESKQEVWYRERDFILYAEATASINKPAAAGAGISAAQPLTGGFIGIDMAAGVDMTAMIGAHCDGMFLGEEITRQLATMEKKKVGSEMTRGLEYGA